MVIYQQFPTYRFLLLFQQNEYNKNYCCALRETKIAIIERLFQDGQAQVRGPSFDFLSGLHSAFRRTLGRDLSCNVVPASWKGPGL